MRNSRSIRLLSLLSIITACASYQNANGARRGIFEYRDAYGKVASFDLDKMTISTPDKILQLSNCSNSDFICFESSEAKVMVPRHCDTPNAFNDYLSGPSDLEFIGNEGLSGNIFKAFRPTDKFGYAYHFRNGIVQLIIIPAHEDKKITKDRKLIPNYTYRISRLKGPLSCEGKTGRNPK